LFVTETGFILGRAVDKGAGMNAGLVFPPIGAGVCDAQPSKTATDGAADVFGGA
jgi:hypothetical protein